MGFLTDVFLPIATTAVSAKYAPQPQRVGLSQVQGYEPGGGFPGYDIIPEPTGMQQCGPKPVFKYSCGGYRWIYPKKKRRKQLLTNSDAAGLAKLKGLVGVGKTMDTWIATHSS